MAISILGGGPTEWDPGADRPAARNGGLARQASPQGAHPPRGECARRDTARRGRRARVATVAALARILLVAVALMVISGCEYVRTLPSKGDSPQLRPPPVQLP